MVFFYDLLDLKVKKVCILDYIVIILYKKNGVDKESVLLFMYNNCNIVIGLVYGFVMRYMYGIINNYVLKWRYVVGYLLSCEVVR